MAAVACLYRSHALAVSRDRVRCADPRDFFYRLAVEAQFGLGETVKAAIDRYRLDIFKVLHQPLPATLSAERALWEQLNQATRPRNTVDLNYSHPAA